jgi:hypothetical protein
VEERKKERKERMGGRLEGFGLERAALSELSYITEMKAWQLRGVRIRTIRIMRRRRRTN